MMQRLESSIKVIRPVGSLTAATVDTFVQELRAALSCERTGEFMIDMSGVDGIDNVGLVSLISAFNEATSLSKHMSLCSVPPSIRIIFELAQLDQFFNFSDSAPETRVAALAA
ncbi:MAG: STAS domain-containing protein [Cyanobacteria bacterium J06628_6]